MLWYNNSAVIVPWTRLFPVNYSLITVGRVNRLVGLSHLTINYIQIGLILPVKFLGLGLCAQPKPQAQSCLTDQPQQLSRLIMYSQEEKYFKTLRKLPSVHFIPYDSQYFKLNSQNRMLSVTILHTTTWPNLQQAP